MAYYLISDFRLGLDTRRLAESAEVGTLRELRNGYVNSGGEVEKLQGFVEDTGLSAALAEARGDGGWIGPMRTHDGGFLFAGVGSRPPSLLNYIAGVPVYWSKLTDASVGLDALAGYDVFRNQVYIAADFGQFNGVKHYYGAPGADLAEVLDGDGTSSMQQPHVRTIASKIWRASGEVLRYSDVNDPTVTDTNNGAGFIDVTVAEGAIGPIQGLGVYQNRLAVFGSAGVQIWTVDPDPSPQTTFLSEVVGGLNVVSGRSILTYDNQDVLFLTPNGVRSLRAQNLSANAAVDDVGTPIDPLVREAVMTGNTTTAGLAALVGSAGEFAGPPAANMLSVIEPVTGQFWVIVGRVIFVFSRFRSAKVAAWSEARLPNHLQLAPNSYVRGAAAASDKLLLCTEDDTGYIYGGETGLEYDTTQLRVTTPLLDFGDPAGLKHVYAIDVVGRGRWTVELAADPADPDRFEYLGTIDGTTTRLHQLPTNIRSTHFSLRLTSTDNTTIPALSRLALHYTPGRKT